MVRVGIAEGLVDLGKVCARVVLVDRLDKVVVHTEHERRLLAGLHAGAGRDDLEDVTFPAQIAALKTLK